MTNRAAARGMSGAAGDPAGGGRPADAAAGAAPARAVSSEAMPTTSLAFSADPDARFDNRYLAELPGEPADPNADPAAPPRPRQVLGAAWSRVRPTPVADPQLLAHSREMAAALGFSEGDVAHPDFAAVFGGNALMDGMDPWAACYGGHQFGVWAGQLGDGRAISLGEVRTGAGERWELQLKGAGMTPYSRRADGRAVLRSSIREFLCSEAMHHLGVPTTRALSLVTTGEGVLRDMFYDGNPQEEPGAVVCRVAPSFVRFGSFEIFTARGDHALLAQMVDFTIARDFPHLATVDDLRERRLAWFREVCERTAVLIAHWMRVGFVHGVMNTDNMSVLGQTIDYGPYGWIDDFDPTWTPNTTDAAGRRYRFGAQPQVAQWNLACLAEAIVPLIGDPKPLEEQLSHFVHVYDEAYRAMNRDKFGVASVDDDALALMRDAFRLLHLAEVDYTLFFRGLADVDVAAPSLSAVDDAFYDAEKRATHEPALGDWLTRWAAMVAAGGEAPEARRARMRAATPRFVLRNWIAQRAIDAAESGDPSLVHQVLELSRRPYDDDVDLGEFAGRRPDWAKDRAGCSMLSCSS
jgi:uncharacterized protein YdiU (UPF0061 family)